MQTAVVGSDSGPRTILVVEDEPLLLNILSDELEDAGYAVVQAATGEQAVEKMAEHAAAIDLLITDIRLPGAIDGWAVAEAARHLRPDLPVIYVTGYSAQPPRSVRDSILITKPYRPSALIGVARRFGIVGSR